MIPGNAAVIVVDYGAISKTPFLFNTGNSGIKADGINNGIMDDFMPSALHKVDGFKPSIY